MMYNLSDKRTLKGTANVILSPTFATGSSCPFTLNVSKVKRSSPVDGPEIKIS